MNEIKIILEINENHANVVKSALDMYSRTLMGQFESIQWEMEKHSDIWKNQELRETAAELLKTLKSAFYPELRNYQSWGISNIKNPLESKIAYEMYKVITSAMAWKENPEGGLTTSFDKPLQVSGEELIEIKIGN